MRVGIVTIFDNNNMGNRLQNYALQQVFQAFADEVVTVETKYRSKSLLQNVLRHSCLADSSLIYGLIGKRRKAKLLRFSHRYIRVSKKHYWFNGECEPLHKADQCDLYCAGSDQVWNPHTGRMDMFNYLGFSPREKTFSYAASFGIDQIPAEYRQAVEQGLRHIGHLSLREDAGKRIVEDLTGREDAQVHIDPTLLLTTQQWDIIAKKPKNTLPQKYLLTYFLGAVSEERKEALKVLAGNRGCHVINLMDPKDPYYAIGAEEFVYLIKNADCVCTDSFHGSVFSFLYGKPLLIWPRQGSADDMSSRLRTLTEKFALGECLVRENIPTVFPEAEYARGYETLERERKKADTYLRAVFTKTERTVLCD